MKFLMPLRSSLLLVLLSLLSASLSKAEPPKADALLTADDLKGYYGTSFQLTVQENQADPALKKAAPVAIMMGMSANAEHVVSLLVRQSPSAAAAQKACDAVREENGKLGIKIEDAPGAGDHGYWFGNQLNFTKGNLSFILGATGLTKDHDVTQAHAAAMALAKKISDRVTP